MEPGNGQTQDESKDKRNVFDKKGRGKGVNTDENTAATARENQKEHTEHNISTSEHLVGSHLKDDGKEFKGKDACIIGESSDASDVELDDGATQVESNKKAHVPIIVLDKQGETQAVDRSARKTVNTGEDRQLHSEREESRSDHFEESADKDDDKELEHVEKSDQQQSGQEARDQHAKDGKVSAVEEKEVNSGEEKKDKCTHEESESKKHEALDEESNDEDTEKKAPEIEIVENHLQESPPVLVGRKRSRRRDRGQREQFRQQKSTWSTLIVLSRRFLYDSCIF